MLSYLYSRPAKMIFSLVALVIVAGWLLAGSTLTPVSHAAAVLMPNDTPTSTPICSLAGSVVSSPNGGPAHNYLNAVAAISSSDIWAVGSQTFFGQTGILIEHWNGTAWSVVTSPAPAVPVSYTP